MKTRTLARAALCVGAMSLTHLALAQETPPPPQPIESQAIGTPVELTLGTGEVLRGSFAGIADDKIVIDHPVLGNVSVPRAQVTAWTVVQPGAAPPAPAPAEPPKPPVPPEPSSFFEGWTGSVELGLNGSEGNTTRLNLRAGFTAERKVELMESKFTLVYTYATEESETTEHKGQAEFRNDWLLSKDSKWRVYALARAEYDQFQNWDWRVSAFGGLGYEFIDTDTTTLIGRIGAGASREFGGDDNRIHPELNLGLDFAHAFTDAQKLTVTLDYYPDLLNFSDFRFVGKAAYEILLDEDSGMTLKLGVEDRYDSTPDGAKRNDLDYFALLVFKF